MCVVVGVVFVGDFPASRNADQCRFAGRVAADLVAQPPPRSVPAMLDPPVRPSAIVVFLSW